MGFWSEVRGILGLFSLYGNENCSPNGIYMRVALEQEVKGIFLKQYPEYKKVNSLTLVHNIEHTYTAYIIAEGKNVSKCKFMADIQSDWGGTIAVFHPLECICDEEEKKRIKKRLETEVCKLFLEKHPEYDKIKSCFIIYNGKENRFWGNIRAVTKNNGKEHSYMMHEITFDDDSVRTTFKRN